MAEKKTYQSTKEALKRRVQSYPPQKYHRLTVAYAEFNEMRKSEVVIQAIKEFFDKMPKQEQERILNRSKHNY
jgi:F0F1-type ATP synthase gamma subunit